MVKVLTDGNGKVYFTQSGSALLGNDMSDDTVVATGSTEPRTLANRFADVINVKDFGAVGDGVTDDTAAIQAAINYATQHGGGVIYGKGLFLIGNVIIKSNVSITSMTIKCKILSTDFANVGACFIFDTNCENSSVYNCDFDGDSTNQTTNYVCGIILNGNNNSIENCNLINVKRNAIQLEPGVTWCNVKNNYIFNTGRFGISHGYSNSLVSSYCKIINNYIENTGNAAIAAIAGIETTDESAGISYFEISNNVIKNTGLIETGGGIGGYSKNNQYINITNNMIDTTSNHGIHFGGKYINITNNTFKNITNECIFIRNWPNINGYASIASNITISNNIIDTVTSASQGYGIALNNAQKFVINGNTVSNTNYAGIYIKGKNLNSDIRCSNGIITNNQINLITGRGIRIDNSDSINVVANTIYDVSSHGIITDNSSYILISNNNINGSANNAHGIYISNSSETDETKGITISYNNIINKTIGIYIPQSHNRIIVRDNILYNNAGGAQTITNPTQGIIDSSAGHKLSGGGSVNIKNGSTITHNLSKVPTKYQITAANPNRIVAITSVDSQYLTVSLTDLQGNAITTAESVNWIASATVGN